MNTHELTDNDSDALTITTQGDRTWITCTSGDSEVTVGPFATDAIAAGFPADPMDGGVTAALIEKETEPDEGAHIGPEGEVDWHGLYLSENRRAEKAEGRADEAHDLIVALRADLAATEARAEDTLSLAQQDTDSAIRQRDEYHNLLEKAEKERDHWKREADGANADLADLRAAEARPLTPTDKMVERVKDRMREQGMGFLSHYSIRELLSVALTEPPARPEGLTRLIDTIREATYDPEPVATGEALYNAGVRPPEDGAA